MGVDPRVQTAMLSLGYDVFPFEAYDSAGRVKVPDAVQFPSYVRDGLGKIAAAPAWAEIYRTLSVLDGEPWRCYMVGVGFQSGTLNIAIFKAASTAPTPQHADRWSSSYQTTVATSLKTFAGNRYAIDPAWFDVLDTAIEKVKEVNDDKKPKDTIVVGRAEGGEPPIGAEDLEVESLNPLDYVLMGLSFVSKFLRTLKLSTEIRTTTFWYATTGVRMDLAYAQRWVPLHRDYRYLGKIRMLHMLWDPASSPSIWSGSAINWTEWLWRMPHEPWQWCRAFYPMGKCGGPSLVYAGLEGEARLAASADELKMAVGNVGVRTASPPTSPAE